jgi:hypothetical protein
VPLRNRFVISFFVVVSGFFLNSCGTPQQPAIQSSPALAKATIGCSSGSPCSASLEVPLILVNGTNPATFGIPISCSLTAGSQPMNFGTAASQPWFATSPASASLQAGASTTIGVFSISSANVSTRNLGNVTVSASGYSSNSQMGVELNCNVEAGSCVVAFSCDPKTNPLP